MISWEKLGSHLRRQRQVLGKDIQKPGDSARLATFNEKAGKKKDVDGAGGRKERTDSV